MGRQGLLKGRATSAVVGEILSEALLTSCSWGSISQKSSPHNLFTSVAIRVVVHEDRGLCSQDVGGFVPQEIVPWGDAVAALATVVHGSRIPALPQHRSV